MILQLVKGGGKAVLLGDDTWGKLIPGKWLRSHAMYSFHTWDLDTVDKGMARDFANMSYLLSNYSFQNVSSENLYVPVRES